jgi:hypothetical protein
MRAGLRCVCVYACMYIHKEMFLEYCGFVLCDNESDACWLEVCVCVCMYVCMYLCVVFLEYYVFVLCDNGSDAC